MPDDVKLPQGLTEPSLADALALIAEDPSLDPKRKAAWMTALRSLCWAIGRPPEALPCRMSSLRHHIYRINAAALGWSEKTLANHKSNAKAALHHVMKTKQISPHGTPLSEDWSTLLEPVHKVSDRRLLSSFGRWCSVQSLAPQHVTAALVNAYIRDKEQSTFHKGGVVYERKIVHAWNRWQTSTGLLAEAPLPVPGLPRRDAGPDWTEFPLGLREDVERYLDSLSRLHRTASGKRRRPSKSSTIETRRRELMAFARKAVGTGIPIATLTSLADLLSEAVVTPTFEAYLAQNGERAKPYTIDLAWKLLSVAKAIGAPAETIERLDDIWGRLEEDRGPKLTEKNLTVIRHVIATDVWSTVVRLPEQMMREALRLRNRYPKKAHAMATTAVQIQILTHAPIRIGNLLSIKLDQNLTKIDPKRYRLHFPGYDVKNRVTIDRTLEGQTAELLDTFIQEFRSSGSKGRYEDWLFLGENGSKRTSAHASAAIAACVERRVGLRITAHQFRHAAAAIILKEYPGNYEMARQVLGHRNVATTQSFYTALESSAAAQQFNKLIEDKLRSTPTRKRRKT